MSTIKIFFHFYRFTLYFRLYYVVYRTIILAKFPIIRLSYRHSGPETIRFRNKFKKIFSNGVVSN